MGSTGTSAGEETCVAIGPANRTVALFLVSVLGLFLELVFIRWMGTEIRIFAYLQNTVLVVCFLGMGVGCLTWRRGVRLLDLLVPLTVFVTLMAIPTIRHNLNQVSQLLSVSEDLFIWSAGFAARPLPTAAYVAVGLSITLLVMAIVFDVFVPIGRLLGGLMQSVPRVMVAYSVNIGGSLLGVWAFVALAAFYAPPVVWLAVAGALMLGLVDRGRRGRLEVGLLAAIVVLGWFAGREPGAIDVTWSPYQKFAVRPAEGTVQKIGGLGRYAIDVNNVEYQEIIDERPEATAGDPDRYPPAMQGFSQYDLPPMFHPHPRTMLIVGAGSGNDAAGALRQGVERITAVEIDPAVIRMGFRYHPEKPYDSSRVTVVNDDARSFFQRAQDRYDVIVFGLLDAHTGTAMTNARLDHYVYTRESLERARTLLAPGGVMVLNFYATRRFIGHRMGSALHDVFGIEPLYFRIPRTGYGRGGLMFVTGDMDVVHAQLRRNPRLGAFVRQWADETGTLAYTGSVATDDWPYLYLEHPSIPLLYYALAGLIGVLLVFRRRRVGLQLGVLRWGRSDWHFFFMGAAFLLLEVQNVSKASVALGNTWEVNAVIISGILLMILLSNLVVARFPQIRLGLVYACLSGACLVLYWVDLASFAGLPWPAKTAAVGLVTAVPIFFSGIVFIRSFARVPDKDRALGANLFGSLVGGLLQSVTFVVGVKALLLIVAALYLCAMFTRPGWSLVPSRRVAVAAS